MATKYDVCYYWDGSRWVAAKIADRNALMAKGYVAVRGLRSIGPPEGPPSKSARERVRDYFPNVDRRKAS